MHGGVWYYGVGAGFKMVVVWCYDVGARFMMVVVWCAWWCVWNYGVGTGVVTINLVS